MTPLESTAQLHGPGLLRNRAFILLFSSMAISLLGDALYHLAIPVWVMQTTGSARDIALLTGTGTIIHLLLAPMAGTVADRSDRRRLMIGADLVRGVVVTLLALAFWLEHHRFDLLLVGAILLAASRAFFAPAYAAAQTGLVHPQDLTRSLSLWQLMRQTITFVGPAAAGLVIATAGIAWALALDGLTFLVSAACLLFIRLHWAPAPPRERRPFWRDFQGGLAVITGNQIILRTVMLGAAVNLAGAAFGVLLPVIALREMGLTPATYGLFQVISPSGVIAGTLLLTSMAGRIALRGRFSLQALLLMGLCNLAMAWLTHPLPFISLLFLSGLFFGLSNVMFADLWRRLVPAEQQGRFFGMHGSLNQILNPVGIGLAGLLSDWLSPYAIAGGAGFLVVALALWGLSTPGLREVR